MGLASIIFLALALSMDAFSVSVTDGMIVRNMRLFDRLKIALFFGAFQFLMPCIGNFIASFAAVYIERFDHWIAFILLSFLGIRMIIEANKEQEISDNPLKTSTLFLMAVATSIDALAAGVTLAAVNASVLYPSLIIGFTTFLLSFAGTILGKRFGDILENKAEIAGGIVLILIGVKTLIEHLF